jgi:mannose-1-phosphate guanylyltransferase/mannose-1-phosphate guanylyltransferase/mannose-6-phosphate isomerase
MSNKKLTPYFDKRPWGHEIWFPNENLAMVKVLTIDPGQKLSLQYHHHRDEFWKVLSGNGSVVIDKETIEVKAGDEKYIEREVIHRIIGGTEPLVILEIQYGKFDEKDIVRLEDVYNRK